MVMYPGGEEARIGWNRSRVSRIRMEKRVTLARTPGGGIGGKFSSMRRFLLRDIVVSAAVVHVTVTLRFPNMVSFRFTRQNEGLPVT